MPAMMSLLLRMQLWAVSSLPASQTAYSPVNDDSKRRILSRFQVFSIFLMYRRLPQNAGKKWGVFALLPLIEQAREGFDSPLRSKVSFKR